MSDSKDIPIQVLPREAIDPERMRLLLRTPPGQMTLIQVAEAVAILRAMLGVIRRRDVELAKYLKEGPAFGGVPADARGHKRVEVGDVVLTLERRPALGPPKRKLKIVPRGPLPPGRPRESELLAYLRSSLSPQDFDRCTHLSLEIGKLEALVQLGVVEASELERYFDAPAEEDPVEAEEPPIFALKIGQRGDLEHLLRVLSAPVDEGILD